MNTTTKDLGKLMDSKVKSNAKLAELSKRVLMLLEDLEKHVPLELQRTFNVSVKQQQQRRYQKACGSMSFWQDKEQVERWMANRNQ
jgi:Cft2 family RNA processing exonuclease